MLHDSLQQLRENKKLILILSIPLLLIAIATIIVLIVNPGSNDNDTISNDQTNVANDDNASSDDIGVSQIEITNHEQLESIPQEVQESMSGVLFRTVLHNNPGISIATIGDVLVREGSFSETYYEQFSIHVGNYIVDIPNLRQSYGARSEWSNDPDNAFFSGYPRVYFCLSEDQLIFGPFDCQNSF